jgi:hypothetical protein
VTAVLKEVERLVGGDEDPDDVLRGVVTALVDGGASAWAGIFFVEEGELVLGPQAGTPVPSDRSLVPVTYEGTLVAELAADGSTDASLLDDVSKLIAPQCLVGWDTGGEPWDE